MSVTAHPEVPAKEMDSFHEEKDVSLTQFAGKAMSHQRWRFTSINLSLDLDMLLDSFKHLHLATFVVAICMITLLAFTMAPSKTKAEVPASTCASKEVIMTVAIIATVLQGGGLIFGFSSFADEVLKMRDPRYTEENVSEVFSAGHQITALGCILSGFMMDYIGPRRHAMQGLIMEAIGLFMLARIAQFSFVATVFAYGLVGWGGCHVLMASLTLTPAFESANFINALLTVAFQSGGFVFMVLPYVQWDLFFNSYGVGCLAMAAVFGVCFPENIGESSGEEEAESDDKSSLKDILLRPKTMWFLLTFMIAGNALIYVAGEFPVALQAKDSCLEGKCANQQTQDYLNNIAKPLFGNFILPVGCAIGIVIDRWGFSTPAVVNVLSVQVLLAALWFFDLNFQMWTVLAYNIANAAVWTIQNAYICNFSEKHIGSLFSISNFLMGVGNFFTDYLALNPFGDLGTSLGVSCSIWVVALFPLYYWGFVVEKQTDQAAVETK